MSSSEQQSHKPDFEHADDAGHFGVHFMLDGYRGDFALLNDAALMRSLLQELPNRLGMNILGTPVIHDVPPISEKDQGGKTGFVVVTESHISIHTFPHIGFVTVDVYTCKSSMDTVMVEKMLVDAYNLKKTEINKVLRGRMFKRYVSESLE